MVTSLASLAAVALNKALLLSRIERLLEGIVRTSVTAIEQRDPATAGHSDRVARLTVGLARVVDGVSSGEYRDVRFTREELKELEYAAILHDIGKVGVREHVLVKAKKLFDPEFSVIRARFDLIKRTIQYECARQIIEVITRLGAEAARPHVKQLEEALERKLAEVEGRLTLVQQLNEPSVVQSEIAAHLRSLGDLRYLLRREPAAVSPVQIGTCRSRAAASTRSGSRSSPTSRTASAFSCRSPGRRLRRVPLIAYSHHERLDGAAIRAGCGTWSADQARMMTIADIFDALAPPTAPTSRRSARTGLDIPERGQAGPHRPDLLDLFVGAKVYAAHGPAGRARPTESRLRRGPRPTCPRPPAPRPPPPPRVGPRPSS
jgi:hypothetical protein